MFRNKRHATTSIFLCTSWLSLHITISTKCRSHANCWKTCLVGVRAFKMGRPDFITQEHRLQHLSFFISTQTSVLALKSDLLAYTPDNILRSANITPRQMFYVFNSSYIRCPQQYLWALVLLRLHLYIVNIP